MGGFRRTCTASHLTAALPQVVSLRPGYDSAGAHHACLPRAWLAPPLPDWLPEAAQTARRQTLSFDRQRLAGKAPRIAAHASQRCPTHSAQPGGGQSHACRTALGLSGLAAAAGLKPPLRRKAGSWTDTGVAAGACLPPGKRLVCPASSFMRAAEYSPASAWALSGCGQAGQGGSPSCCDLCRAELVCNADLGGRARFIGDELGVTGRSSILESTHGPVGMHEGRPGELSKLSAPGSARQGEVALKQAYHGACPFFPDQ